MKKTLAIACYLALAFGPIAVAQVKHDAEEAGRAAGRTAKDVGKKAKKTTKKGVHKSAGAVEKGAHKVKKKTQEK
jgi:hypothetical protein